MDWPQFATTVDISTVVTLLSVVEDSASGSSNNTAAIIIGLVVALLALAGICCALVYKIKMEKLRLMYDQQVRWKISDQLCYLYDTRNNL